MATFNLVAATNIDECASKGGGDTYNLLGYTLTVDQDSRIGVNASSTTSLGNINGSTTLGGTVRIDARKVRLIPFDTGSGTVPAWNTLITQGSASGKLIGVYSSLTSDSVATGGAMPATGWIKIKQWNDVAYSAGALTGITANATGTDVVGWLEIVGDESCYINVPRRAKCEILGAWYELGTTNNTANQQFQIPTNGRLRHIGCVFIETGVGSGTFEPWANAGTATDIATDTRGKVVWISTAGVVTIGHNGTSNAGYVPVSGLRVVVGNVFCENCTTASRSTNAAPNATLGTRYDFNLANNSDIELSKCCLAWFAQFQYPQLVKMTLVSLLERLELVGHIAPLDIDGLGLGNYTNPSTHQALWALYNKSGGTVNNASFVQSQANQYNAALMYIDGCSGITFSNCCAALARDRTSIVGAIWMQRSRGLTFHNTRCIGSFVYIDGSPEISFTGYLSHADAMKASATDVMVTSYSLKTNNAVDLLVDGFDWFGVTGAVPGYFLSQINLTSGARLRNFGTRASPLNCNTRTEGFKDGQYGSFSSENIKFQRIWLSNTKNSYWAYFDSSLFKGVQIDNCGGDAADTLQPSFKNGYVRGFFGIISTTASVGATGTHFYDCFTSTTAGRIGILFNEKDDTYEYSTSAYEIMTNGGSVGFTGNGGLYLPAINDQIVYTWPWFILGHSAFPVAEVTMGGGTISNYKLRYQIDKNDGNGWSGWKNLYYRRTGASGTSGQYTVTVTDATGVAVGDYVWGTGIGTSAKVTGIASNTLTLDVANSGTVSGTLRFNHLPSETGFGYASGEGVKLKVEITTTSTNTDTITSLYITTTTSTTAIDAGLYDLDTNTLTLTGLVAGSEIHAYAGTDPATATEIGAGVESSGTSYSITHNAPGIGYITVVKPNYKPMNFSWTFDAEDAEIPIFQIPDLGYLNP